MSRSFANDFKYPINICFCIDEGYVPYLGAVLTSLIDSNKHNTIDIYVLTSDVSESSKQRLEAAVKAITNFTITFVNAKDQNIKRLEAGGHISSATYIRFEIPELLSKIDKVLYLDADLIILDDIVDYWNIDISEYYVAAVENPFFDRYSSLGMKPSYGYFNAGVLLINLSKWRKDNVKEKALDFLNENKINAIMYDQDALNAIFSGCWKKVGLRWNLQTSYLRRKLQLPTHITEITDAYNTPGIIHFSSSSKPWDFLDPHPYTSVYKKYEGEFGGKVKRKKLTRFEMLRSAIRWVFIKAIYLYQLK